MKKVIVLVIAGVFLSLAAQAEEAFLSVNELIRNMDSEKHTKAEINEYAKTVKGRQAEGRGKVVNVIEGRRDRHKVTILTEASSPEKGNNVVLYTTMNAPAELKMNEMIRFRGEVGRASTFRGLSIDIHGTYEKVQ